MTSKIEEVARAIAKVDGFEWDSLNRQTTGSIAREEYRAEARAAIEAMRTVDDAMMQAGVSADYGKTLGERITNTHQAMIDAALGEP